MSLLIRAGRTKRMRNLIVSHLEKSGEANTIEIFNHINGRMHSGTTMQQLGNIMAKDPRFITEETKRVRGACGQLYDVQLHRLASDYKSYSYR